MPAISKVGSGWGTPDYADLHAWETAEQNNTYSGVGPIAEVSGTTTLTANLQIRDGWTLGCTIRAVAGEEFDGNFGGTHANIAGAGFDVDVRVDNVSIEDLDVIGDITSTGDTCNGLAIDRCGVQGQQFLNLALTSPVSATGSVFYIATGAQGRAIYVYVDCNLDHCTLLTKDTTDWSGVIYLRSGPTVDIQDCAVYAPNNNTVIIHDTGTLTGDYNAGNDALLPGANSITTLGTDDFVDYANDDYRIATGSELRGAGSAGGDIGAFFEPAGATVPAITDIDTDEDIYPGQTGVVITGSGFLTSGATVRLNSASDGTGTNVAQTVTTHASDTSITITVVQGALSIGTVYAFVQNTDTEENATGFTVTLSAAPGPEPTITDVDTDETVALGQTGVVITGTNFEAVQGTGGVRLNTQSDGLGVDLLCTETAWSDTSITVTVPVGLPPGSAYVFVQNDTGDENATGFAITLTVPAGYESVNYDGSTVPEPSETLQEMALTDFALTMVNGDIGLIGTITDVTWSPNGTYTQTVPATVGDTYYVWDNSTSTMYGPHAFTLAVQPTLSSPSLTSSGQTTMDVGVTTDHGSGTWYWYLSESATPPSAADLKAGTASDAFGSKTVTVTGVQTDSATGLQAGTTYYKHSVHTNSGVDSDIVTSTGVETDLAANITPVLNNLRQQMSN
ncbi:MAG: hypothetical protein KZQ95_01795 [Candidatus Thiodiazotropha sp. (ex Epidulcina cf. delphinae)]|nr:hypothetical protein [Candidatus Thiodiazotropha sp. (ex Epidulcina cf. delphinae)]